MTAYMGLIYRKVGETDMEECMKIFGRFTGPASVESLDEQHQLRRNSEFISE